MENQQNEQIETATQEQMLPQSSTPKYRRILIVLGIIICLLTVGAFVLIATTQQKKQSETILTSAIPPSVTPSMTPKIKNQYEISQTKIANTLDVPPLYPNIKWEEGDSYERDRGLNEVGVAMGNSFDYVNFSISGESWQTTVPLDISGSITQYYFDELQKRGWFGEDGVGRLKFDSFNLIPLSAGGPCGSLDEYIGYKDSMIRVITVSYNYIPCIAPGDPTPTKISIDFVIFISDPVPIEKIADYIESNSGFPPTQE